jgi:hypothetical protein
MAAVGGGRQRRGQNNGIRIGGAHGRGDAAQHLRVGDRVDVPRTPVRRDVGFIPKLIVADVLAVTMGKGGCKIGKIGKIGRRRQVVASRRIFRRQGPIRRGVEHGNRFQPGGGDGGHQPVRLRPVKVTGSGLDLLPVKVMAHPAKASRVQISKARIDERGRTPG